jgi:hypothetical protein
MSLSLSGAKSLFASKTFWGAALAVLAGIASILGYTISAADQAQISELVIGMGALFGGWMAIYGRIKATKVIR